MIKFSYLKFFKKKYSEAYNTINYFLKIKLLKVT